MSFIIKACILQNLQTRAAVKHMNIVFLINAFACCTCAFSILLIRLRMTWKQAGRRKPDEWAKAGSAAFHGSGQQGLRLIGLDGFSLPCLIKRLDLC
ncbi:MAG: hypothetical protein LBU32_15260 [Clostridiales bacterium]|nr:hypothetical protein [Clostridiales bacterium]